MKRKIALLVLSVLTAASVLAGGVYAWFTGDRVVNSIVIKTGSVDFAAELYLASDFNRDGYLDRLGESEKTVAENIVYEDAENGDSYEFTKLPTTQPIKIGDFLPDEIVTFRIDIVNRSTAQSAGNVSFGLDFGSDAAIFGGDIRVRKFALDAPVGAWNALTEGETYLPVETDAFYSEQSARISLLFQVCFWSDGDQGSRNASKIFDQCKIRVRFDAVADGATV